MVRLVTEYQDTVVELEEAPREIKIEPRRLAGRCSNGAERDGGELYHAVVQGASRALCNAYPGRQSAGWSEHIGDAVNCPRCLAKIPNLQQRTQETTMTQITATSTIEAQNRKDARKGKKPVLELVTQPVDELEEAVKQPWTQEESSGKQTPESAPLIPPGQRFMTEKEMSAHPQLSADLTKGCISHLQCLGIDSAPKLTAWAVANGLFPAPTKSAPATGDRGPGVIATIIELAERPEGVTLPEFLAVAKQRFPDRLETAVTQTYKVQTGSRIQATKGDTHKVLKTKDPVRGDVFRLEVRS